MASNERMALFQSMIGKELCESGLALTSWLNGVIREVNEGAFAVEFTVRPEMANPVGILHGGIHALIIDDVIGMTVYALGRENVFFSVNLTVDFLGKAKIGEKVTARSRVIRQGNQIINVECEIFDEKGNIISRGTSNMFKTNLPA